MNASNGTSSLRIKPFEASAPSLSKSSTAVMPAAVLLANATYKDGDLVLLGAGNH